MIEVGKKIKELRNDKGLSLKDVAESTGVTKSMLSQIERGISSPSINTLKKIADCLGMPVAYFFSETAQAGPVVRKNERKILKPPDLGVEYELLSPNLQRKMEFIFTRFSPGKGTGDDLYTHDGEECGIVLKGRMRVFCQGNVYDLEEGDSIYFDSTQPHGFLNIGEEDVEVIFCITPPSF